MRTVQRGGDLKIGDFVAISYAYGFEFAWYCGEGENTLQFFEYNAPSSSLKYYNNVKQDAAYRNHAKANSEEFNKKWIIKENNCVSKTFSSPVFNLLYFQISNHLSC